MASLICSETQSRVSSVLNRDVKQYGKKFMFDWNEETCWNSDQPPLTLSIKDIYCCKTTSNIVCLKLCRMGAHGRGMSVGAAGVSSICENLPSKTPIPGRLLSQDMQIRRSLQRRRLLWVGPLLPRGQ